MMAAQMGVETGFQAAFNSSGILLIAGMGPPKRAAMRRRSDEEPTGFSWFMETTNTPYKTV